MKMFVLRPGPRQKIENRNDRNIINQKESPVFPTLTLTMNEREAVHRQEGDNERKATQGLYMGSGFMRNE